MIKKDFAMSIREHVNESKVREKTARTEIKQGLSPGLNLLHHAIWGVLENITNATSTPYFGSLNTAIEEKWNKMPEVAIHLLCILMGKSLMKSNHHKKCLSHD